MKRYITGITAFVLAAGIVAFTRLDRVPKYWFKYNGSTFVWDRHDETASISCTPLGFNNCARGYISQPESDGQGGYVYPGSTPDSEVKKQ